MNVAILANNSRSFVISMAEGLRCMLGRIGVDSAVFRDGLSMLAVLPPESSWKGRWRHWAWKTAHGVGFFHRLRAFDVIVVVGYLPMAFTRDWNVEWLRHVLPDKPVVLYANYYLPTRYNWSKLVTFGMGRYDWYLCSSVVSACPLPSGPHPYSVIGIDLDDGALRPEQGGDFRALLDFEREGFAAHQKIQIAALEETGTPYEVLQGALSREDIRSIYRRTAIYFLAHVESFGWPVCELQACGSYIMAAEAIWAQSHWIKDDLSKPGPGVHSPNIVVYDNDKTLLKDKIREIRESYDPKAVVETFRKHHPQLFHGDTQALQDFVDRVSVGEIHSRLHEQHRGLCS